MNFLDIFLGVLTAVGGFIDISNLVFNTQAGAIFHYSLLWPIVIGAIGIALYSEMAGRIAAVAKKPDFDLIRERMGFPLGMTTLIASLFITIMTCAAEIGGIAIVLRLLSALPYFFTILIAGLIILLVLWLLKFKWLERVFGFLGLFLLVLILVAFNLHPNLKLVGEGFIPQIPSHLSPPHLFSYLYFVIGVISSIIMPYNVFFYSSGGIEEHWTAKDLLTNRVSTYVGYIFGSVLAVALTIIGAIIFHPLGIQPQLLSSVALGSTIVFGKIGLIMVLLGILFAVGGAAVETSLAGAYSLSQFFGWHWGRYEKPSKTPFFTLTWIIIIVIAVLILFSGINPVSITQYAVIFSIVALPFTYIPIYLVSNDKFYMGKYVNGRITNTLGIVYLIIIVICAVTALPLFFLSQGGST